MRECLWICPPSLWYLCLLLSDRVSGLHGLAFSLCRSVLKPNTGIRSHLPGMAWMPSTVPVPRCHKTEVASGVTIEIGAIGRDLRWSLHNFTFHCRASGGCRRGVGETTGRTIKAHRHLFDRSCVCAARWAVIPPLRAPPSSVPKLKHCAFSPVAFWGFSFKRVKQWMLGQMGEAVSDRTDLGWGISDVK